MKFILLYCRVENLFCRLSKYNVGKLVDTMSRGSYQRRVYITGLQHNDGYNWQDSYMHMFTGENPGYFMRKIIQERNKAFLRTKRTRNKPGFSRQKTVQCVEEEHDYGDEAVS